MADYSVYAPLSDFAWNGENLSFAPGIEIIKRPPSPYPLRGLDDDLTTFDRADLFHAQHWLRLDWDEGASPSDAELLNLFLLSSWIAKPTKAHAKFRFAVRVDTREAPGDWARLHDQFQWIQGAAGQTVTTADLAEASLYFPYLLSALNNRDRLANALFLSFGGCISHLWQVALACFAGAAEALLTYATGRGITDRLSRSFASLVAVTSADRDRQYLRFSNLYNKRSDVMHGRGHLIPVASRLAILADFGDALREMWKAVLLSPANSLALEGSDTQRAQHFRNLQGAWNPPASPP